LSRDPAAHISIHLGPVHIPEAFLEGKDRVEEFHVENAFNSLFFSGFVNRFDLRDYNGVKASSLHQHYPFLRRDFMLDEAILRQKKVQVIELIGEQPSFTRIIEKLAENPDRAEQITTIAVEQGKFNTAAVPNWTNLKNLELNIRPFVMPSFSDYLVRIAMTSNKLECLKSKTAIKNSKEMSTFLLSKKDTLKKLQLPNYKCSEEDIETLTSNCDKIEELELDCSDISRQDIRKVFKLTNLSNLHITSLSSALSVNFLEQCIRSLPKLQTLRLRFNNSYVFIDDSFRFAEMRFYRNNGPVSTNDELVKLFSLPRMSEVEKIKLNCKFPIRDVKLLKRLQNSF
jgi:hypothetical protein